jgi:hypothetical protein
MGNFWSQSVNWGMLQIYKWKATFTWGNKLSLNQNAFMSSFQIQKQE